MNERLRARRTRIARQRWRYRQRNHAAGVWDRLRLALAYAEAIFAVDEAVARKLVDEGFEPLPAGRELQPAKLILFIPPVRLREIAGLRELRPHLDIELLSAPALLLRPFAVAAHAIGDSLADG